MKKFLADLWASKAFRSAVYSAGAAFATYVSQWVSTTDFGGAMGGVVGASLAFVIAQLTAWLGLNKPVEAAK